MNGLINDSVGVMLQEYQANRQKEWIKKTSVLNLIITASIAQYTYRNGAQEINISFEVLGSYLEQLILPEMDDNENVNNLPILKATCLKFLYMFRNQLPDHFVGVFV